MAGKYSDSTLLEKKKKKVYLIIYLSVTGNYIKIRVFMNRKLKGQLKQLIFAGVMQTVQGDADSELLERHIVQAKGR